MAIERPRRTERPRHATRPLGPASFDDRELDLAESVRRHVLLRDACLAPAPLMPGRLQRLGALDGRVVARLATERHHLRNTGALLPDERRRLVLLDVLATLTDRPDPDGPWSRDPVDLVGEAAEALGHTATDVRRLARSLAKARAALPRVDVPASLARTLAEPLQGVLGVTPGAAIAQSVLLLTDRLPRPWSPSSCGLVLLDPAPLGPSSPCPDTFLGTMIARADLAAFVEDLATLRVAADVSPTLRRYAHVLLPDLADELRHTLAPDRERDVLHLAATLVDRTTALLPRGFRRYDRSTHRRGTPRIVLGE